MENKSFMKSRKEKRKEARTCKNERKFQSWNEDQKSKKLKKKSWGSESKNGKNTKKSFAKFSENRKDSKPIGNCESDRSSEKPVLVKKSDVKLNSSGDGISSVSVLAKRKNGLETNPKTKFEEYLQLTMQKNSVSAEDDLKFERQLAKKLKVKKSKLRGEDDGINMLFKGIPSVIDSFEEDEIPDVEELAVKKSSEDKFPSEKRKILDQGPESERHFDMDAGESVEEEETAKASSRKKCRRRKSSNQGSVGGTTGEEGVGVSSEICGADAAEEDRSKEPAVEENVAYVAPHLRSRSRNESEEFIQFRRRVRGLLNRLSESNVESITAEISSIFRSVSRSVASQIISEEVLASCSGGPRGNEQSRSHVARHFQIWWVLG